MFKILPRIKLSLYIVYKMLLAPTGALDVTMHCTLQRTSTGLQHQGFFSSFRTLLQCHKGQSFIPVSSNRSFLRHSVPLWVRSTDSHHQTSFFLLFRGKPFDFLSFGWMYNLPCTGTGSFCKLWTNNNIWKDDLEWPWMAQKVRVVVCALCTF